LNLDDEQPKGWWMDKHVTATWMGTMAVQTVVGLVWLTWIASGYSADIIKVKEDLTEMRLELRALQASFVTQSALADKRLAVLESAIPEMKQTQREMQQELRKITELLGQIIRAKRDNAEP
jgi:hypothetical protein